ncbi:MAG: hypothetical protein ACT4N9_13365 [Paracoccaceae bacterium]
MVTCVVPSSTSTVSVRLLASASKSLARLAAPAGVSVISPVVASSS